MEYVFPAIFHKNGDESYTITYPDLPGCISEGKNLANAMYMAELGLKQWISYLADKKQKIPAASHVDKVKTNKREFVNLVRVELKDEHAVRRMVSIPKWMDDKAASSGLSLSRILQDALTERLA
ncbi:MAG: type II toxin-antitoxin system HicB family antitoxin [Spirochaetaceae bacterium]|jgi:predicted RNase H-like HicB family nuclease|nr:type II toxin-antitoxin system HicB family antitoxin [Spirochaetaceae bacterium]